MDPITAVGLVTNVVDLVEASWKIVSKGREIYRLGALPDQRDTKTVTADLQRINNKLLAYLSIAEADTKLSEDDKALRQLCESSNRIATELIGRLAVVRADDDHQAWKSLRQALKSVWIKTELDDTAARLQAYRTQLNTRILVSLRDKVDTIDQGNRNIASSIAENRVLLNSGQEVQTDYLTRLITSQHEKTRDLLSALTIGGSPPPYPSTAWRRSPSPGPEKADGKDRIFQAVADGDITQIRRILRDDPQAIFVYNEFGQTLLHVAARRGDHKMIAYLLRNGAKVNPDDDDGRLPIHEAAEQGSELAVRALVAKGADLVVKDSKGQTPRDLCLSMPLLQWIMVHGAQIEARDETGSTALLHFADQGNLDAVRTLVEQGAELETTGGSNSRTPLWGASDCGHTEVVEYLLAFGAAVNFRDHRRSTPLVAASYYGYTSVGELLLDHCADIDAANQHDFTALNECLEHDHADTALMLLARGASIDNFTQFGYAPLHQAARRGHLEPARAILDRSDCNVNILHSTAHWTALAEACEHGHSAIVELLLAHGAATEEWTGHEDRRTALGRAAEHGYTEIVRLLLEVGGADANATDGEGRTTLYLAIQGGHAVTSRLLLEEGGAKPDIGDEVARYTPLCLAAQRGRADLVRMLLDAGADPNRPGKDAWTPLHEAAWHGHVQSVQLLLQKGARLDLRNSGSDTALTLAQVKSHRVIVAALERHQAPHDGWVKLDGP